MPPSILLLIIYLLFREMARAGEREGEKRPSAASPGHPRWGPGLQPRHTPWLGIALVIFRFVSQH